MNYSAVENLIWRNPEHTVFDCDVTFDHLGKVPFACSKEEAESNLFEHSTSIWNRAISGEFGEIAEYVEYVPEATEPQPEVSGAQTL